MTVTTFDQASYQHLLSEVHPRVPQTEAENEALIQMVKELQDKAHLSPEEQALTEVLLALIEKFEDEHYSTAKAPPDATLRELMRAHDLRPKDLYEVFGSKGTTSEVLRGKRAISRAAAKVLAKRFSVKVDLFL